MADIKTIKSVIEILQEIDSRIDYYTYLSDLDSNLILPKELANLLINRIRMLKRETGTNDKTGKRKRLERLENRLITLL